MCSKCLVYPGLQKFYNALNHINRMDIKECIFNIIPEIDSFFSEMRNVTFVIQKNFNSKADLKSDYENLKDKFLTNNETMSWFVKIRNETIKEHPIRLEKAFELEIYLTDRSLQSYNTILTVDSDYDFSVLNDKLINFLELNYAKYKEVFLSTNIILLKSGEKKDLYSTMLEGISIMNSFIEELFNKYPCSCDKCTRLNKCIKSLILNVNVKKLTFSSDLCYSDKKLKIGSQIYFISENQQSLLSSPFPLKNSHFDFLDALSNDLTLLKVFAGQYISLARMQRCECSTSELMPVFLIRYEDSSLAFYGPFSGTINSTMYRAISDICKIVNKISVRAVLMMTEVHFYKEGDLSKLKNMKYLDRVKESIGTGIQFSLLTKHNNMIQSIIVDYGQLFDDFYMSKQMQNVYNFIPSQHVAFPIFQALHKN